MSMTTTTEIIPHSPDAPAVFDEPFEGPEKKLEVFFSCPPDDRGFRRFSQPVWSDVLSDAHCSILHVVGNGAFDAYLLSESSLFVYPHKLILKTCGTTTLLLVLPKLLMLAAQLGVALSHVHYSHYRYAFPHLQPSPHSSFDEEQATVRTLLDGHIAAVTTAVLGADHDDDAEAARWVALCASAPASTPAPLESPHAWANESDVIEVAMDGLAPSVCALFMGDAHGALTGRALANAMSDASGIRELVSHALLDDWAFEPCGYSMNALSAGYYYTVHITPELGFSYASFETNDPSYATDERLAQILDVFQPSHATISLTSRNAGKEEEEAAAARLAPRPPKTHFATVAPWRRTRLSPDVSVAVAAFSARQASPPPPMRRAPPTDSAACDGASGDEAASTAEDTASADSESTAALEDVGAVSEGEGPASEAGVVSEGVSKRARLGDKVECAAGTACA